MDAKESDAQHEAPYNSIGAFTYAWDAELVFVPDVDVPHGDLEIVDNFGHQRRN